MVLKKKLKKKITYTQRDSPNGEKPLRESLFKIFITITVMCVVCLMTNESHYFLSIMFK